MHGRHCNPGASGMHNSEGHYHHCALLWFNHLVSSTSSFKKPVRRTTNVHRLHTSLKPADERSGIFSALGTAQKYPTDPGRASEIFIIDDFHSRKPSFWTRNSWNILLELSKFATKYILPHFYEKISKDFKGFSPGRTGNFRVTSNTSVRFEELARTEPKNNLPSRISPTFPRILRIIVNIFIVVKDKIRDIGCPRKRFLKLSNGISKLSIYFFSMGAY